MTHAVRRPALVCNSRSGSHDEIMLETLSGRCRDAGTPLVATFTLPDGRLPDADALAKAGIDTLLVWTGDGTINAAAGDANGWDGAIVPLPGGTLNLLSKALHGDRAPDEILSDALSGRARRIFPPIIRCEAGDAYITLVAGPATRWAEVRETLRSDGLIEASQEAPEALAAMLEAPGVRVAPDGADYPAIVLTPTPRGIRAHGVLAESAADILRHGLAWLGGDFRDGPSEAIATAAMLTLESSAPIAVELDGEVAELRAYSQVWGDTSSVAFLATA